jgi:hypothetical protein
VAGKDLSLHALYRQVTGLGGVIAVTADNKWPVSFVVRPAYASMGRLWQVQCRLLSDFAYKHAGEGRTGGNGIFPSIQC